ncbi:MAG: hypothetical protein AMS27_04200 [Bacteroides sp. SM23_62_1]|nr:MAG: hypothetical protein AMS27_04200 [Bacteroides sp. SM23_62_1]
MNHFLEEIAKHLYSAYGDKLKDCCVVFPNRRAGLFFNKYLSELTEKPVWAPEYFTISDLMVELSELEPADELLTLFELYKVYCEEKNIQESFDEFYFWGEIMLADFDNIDKYLVNATKLFQNITDLRNIEDQFSYLSEEQIKIIKRFWQNFEPGWSGQHKDKFLETWKVLNNIYSRLRDILAEHNIGYEGMIYRDVADKLVNGEKINLPFLKIFFIGFNALNECENALFKYLSTRNLAEFFWDYDEYYLVNKNHEAGRFIRRNIDEFGATEINLSFSSLTTRKEIRVVSVPSMVGQAKILPELLSNMEDISHETAIVMADEHLLVPVLHSLPESADDFNVTMGYPVDKTPVYALIEHIIDLQNNSRRQNDQKWRFYYRDVLAILNHPFIHQDYETEIDQLIDDITERNKIYLTGEELNINTFLGSIFTRIDEPKNIPAYLLHILEKLARDNINQEHSYKALENEIIFQLYVRIKRLKEIIDNSSIQFLTRTLFRLLRKTLMHTRIPFSGEPLIGLQIMGVLETRGLDFKNLIMLSMNEDIFPGSPVSHSFIPHHLRFGFGLPTIEHQDAIYAYYFYRLIQRAERIILVYNSKTEGLSTGEKSRFIHQLLFDPAFSVNEKIIAYNIQANPEKPVWLSQDKISMDILNTYISENIKNKYLSPSALNVYIDCRLRFYFRYIARLEEPDEVAEEVNQLLFGNMLHAAINRLYEPLMEGEITSVSLRELLNNKVRINSAIHHAFNQEYQSVADKGKAEIEGRNLIVREILKQYLIQIINTDINYTPFRIIDLEGTYRMDISVKKEDKLLRVSIGGKIDRIDNVGNEIRIIDYKTGRVDRKISDIDSLFDRDLSDRNHAVFQTLLYSKLFYSSEKQQDKMIVPGLYAIRELTSNDFDYHILFGAQRNKEILSDYQHLDIQFTKKLIGIVEEMYNKDIGFFPTRITEKCEYCPYREICHR